MSNFDFEAYRQVYPEVKETAPEVESVVETFKPTEEKLNEKPTDTEAGVADEGGVEDAPTPDDEGTGGEENPKGDDNG